MQSGPSKFALGLALLLSLVVGVFAADAQTARPVNLTGRVTVNKGKAVGPDTKFAEGDVVEVAAGGRVTIRTSDGADVDLVGPAKMLLGMLRPEGNRFQLQSGYVALAYVQGVALGIQTPYGSELVLQNASARARVVPGDKVVFDRVEGSYLKIYEGQKSQSLAGTWSQDLRASTAKPSDPDSPLKGDTARIKLGERYITYSPAGEFSKEDRPEGGVRLIYNGSDYGRVDVGIGTVLFVSQGEHVDFDGNGNVTSFNGISHIYHPIDWMSFYDEPIENAADASVADPRGR